VIRLLAEHDREQVMGLLAPESALNLFIIGDVENNGFGQEFQQLWGDFDAAGRLRAVLLRYYGSFIPYAPGEFELDGLAEVLIGRRHRITAFSGIDRVIRPFETYPGLLPENARKRTLSFLELRGGDRLAGPEGGGLGGQAFRAGPDDVPAYLKLWAEVNGLERSDEVERSHRREIEQGAGRVYLLRQGDQVVATVKTTAETSSGAVITGVTTHPAFRRRGLATSLLVLLCRELLGEGKRPCLFYDNPEAGGIYRRLGFTDAGTWVMYAVGPGEGTPPP